MKLNRKFISLITIFMLVLSVPCVSFAVSEEPVDVTENTTIVDVSGIEDGQAASDELLVLVDEGTSKSAVSGIAEDAGASLDNISTLGDGTKLARVTIDGENDAQTVAVEIAADDAVLIVQPNYIYHLEESEEGDGSSDEIKAEDDSDKDTENDAVQASDQSIGNEDSVVDEASISDADTEATSEEGSDAEAEETQDNTGGVARTIKVVDKDTLEETGGTINQWYLGNTSAGTHAESAWNSLLQSSQGDKVKVAVIDTGVKLDHGDLADNILTNKCVTFNGGEKLAFDALDGSDDEDGHGTHVCGLIAATVNDDNYGMKGVANDRAELFVIDASLKNGGFTSQDLVLSINYASENADVINISIGGLYKDYVQERTIQTVSENGTLVVCASGNFNSELSESPGDSSAAVSVMSHGANGDKSSFSDFGVYKDISAPGSNIVSTYIGGNENVDNYAYVSGTSMASPLVAGIAALIKSEDDSLNSRELKNYLYTSSGNRSFDNSSGFGKVNALTAVQNVNGGTSDPDNIVLNSTSLNLWPGEEFSLEYAVYPGTASKYADDLTFSSSKESVATVDANGKVHAIGAGDAVVTATCHGVTKECSVTVNDIEYKSIDYPCDEYKGSFSGSSHKLQTTMKINGKEITFEALVNGYQFNVTDAADRIGLMAISSDAIPLFKVFDPDGNEMAISQDNYKLSKNYISVAEMDPLKAGTYKFQLLCNLNGEDVTGVKYTMTVFGINDLADAKISGVTQKTYTGRAQTQSPVVKLDGTVLEYGTDYTLSYSNNVNAGTATMTVTGMGDYKGSQNVSFKINKAGNGLSVAGKTYKIKRSKVKKKAKKVAVSSVMTVKRANGVVRYAKVSGSKKLSINASTGAVTIKKKTKKGTYKMIVNVTAAGDANHSAVTRRVTIKVKVK